jgi:hypothetical protein
MICSPFICSGLGNILFKAAAAYSYSLENGFQFSFFDCLAHESNCTHRSFSNYKSSVFKNFPHSSLNIGNAFVFKEPAMLYSPIPKFDKDVILVGDFQSQKYFQFGEKNFLDLLNVPAPCKEGDSTCFVHVRRGDYLNHSNFYPTLSIDYYRRAISNFNSNVHLAIVSDDIIWCKQNLTNESLSCSNVIFYSDNKTPEEDLSLMSSCDHGITANSTFSWWGAFLIKNPNKKIITPDTWISEELAALSCSGNLAKYMEDLIPESWTKQSLS